MTASITLPNGNVRNVEELAASFYRNARWNVGVEGAALHDGDPLAPGPGYKLTIDDITWSCAVDASREINSGRSACDIVGGSGGIRQSPVSRHFSGATLKQVALFLLGQARETLSASSDPDLLQFRTSNNSWTVNSESSVWYQLLDILDQAGAVARWQKDGSVLLTRDKNPTQFVIPNNWTRVPNEKNGLIQVVVDRLSTVPEPGQLDLDGNMIQHMLVEIKDMRCSIATSTYDFFENSTGYAAAKSRAQNSYPATIVSKINGWRYEVQFEDRTLFANGLTEVPVQYGSPLMSAAMSPGTKVIVNFQDPGKPYISGFPSKYVDQPLTSDKDCVFFGNPTNARSLARKGDITRTYLPKVWNATVMIPPGVAMAGGPIPAVVVLKNPLTKVPSVSDLVDSALPVGTLKLVGVLPLGSNNVKAE